MIGILVDRIIVRSDDESLVRNFKSYINNQALPGQFASFSMVLQYVRDYGQEFTSSYTVFDMLFNPKGKYEEVIMLPISSGKVAIPIERETTN